MSASARDEAPGEYLPVNEACPTPAGALRGELKQVTMMFADLSGFTAMTEHRDADEVVVLVNACLAHLSECVYRYRGTIDKYIRDGVMALFGAAHTHEDAPERAIRAALDIQQALFACKANPPLPVSADSLPDEERRRHMLGTPAAANLHAKAEPYGQYGS